MCTIIHELTHWLLGTIDATMNGRDCYGVQCLLLAKSVSKAERLPALNNADNWVYYICQYRAIGDGGDWRFFTEEEITQRGGFAPPYGQVAGVMALV